MVWVRYGDEPGPDEHESDDAPAPPAPSESGRTLLICALLILALPTALLLFWPTDGDQALFALGARMLADGGVYYRDLWDIKQPGIYWFYQAGQALVPGETGPRLLEIGLVLAAGALLGGELRRRGAHPWTVVLGPALVFTPYLLLAYRAGAGQVEGLCVSLLVAHVALTGLLARPGEVSSHSWARGVSATGRRRSLRWAAAGILAGAVVVLKTVYGILPLILLAGAVVVRMRGPAADRRALLRDVGWYAAGASVPVLATIGYLTAHGVAGVAWFTTLALPAQISALDSLHPPDSVAYLIKTVLRYFWIPLLLAAAGLAGLAGDPALRRRWAPAVVTFGLAIAAFSALAATQYITSRRLLTLAALLGIPALLGLERLARSPQRRAAVATIAGLATAIALTMTQGVTALAATGHVLATDATRIADRSDAMSGGRSAQIAAPVARMVAPGAGIYVFGDPRIYSRLGARQTVPIMGWSSEFLTAPVWAELTRELECVRPAFVHVDEFSLPYVRAGAPRILDWLGQEYVVVSGGLGSAAGTWWQRRDSGSGSASLRLQPPECTPVTAGWRA